MRFFKKISPSVKLGLSNGRAIQFTKVDVTWGIFQTSNPEVIAELEAAIRNEIGGVSEITQAEFVEMEQKKTTSSVPWREEISKSQSGLLRPPTNPPKREEPAVVVAERFPAANLAQRQPITAQPTPTFKPTATPRK